MAIVYTQEVYNIVVSAKEENNRDINSLSASLQNMTYREKVEALNIIDALRNINIEYDKYISVYNTRLNNSKTRRVYTVVEGDSLPLIAYRTLGDWTKWQDIYRHNNLDDILLESGRSLEIPE